MDLNRSYEFKIYLLIEIWTQLVHMRRFSFNYCYNSKLNVRDLEHNNKRILYINQHYSKLSVKNNKMWS